MEKFSILCTTFVKKFSNMRILWEVGKYYIYNILWALKHFVTLIFIVKFIRAGLHARRLWTVPIVVAPTALVYKPKTFSRFLIVSPHKIVFIYGACVMKIMPRSLIPCTGTTVCSYINIFKKVKDKCSSLWIRITYEAFQGIVCRSCIKMRNDVPRYEAHTTQSRKLRRKLVSFSASYWKS